MEGWPSSRSARTGCHLHPETPDWGQFQTMVHNSPEHNYSLSSRPASHFCARPLQLSACVCILQLFRCSLPANTYLAPSTQIPSQGQGMHNTKLTHVTHIIMYMHV